ncbi:MAG TPA: response regulator transcription factor [Candidatus Acidoferrum sp.]|jgi:DNA-binding NarL/FixJ family response regulator|nr:response regulator transcription factor [Candidatus Acidoferrum sp.]
MSEIRVLLADDYRPILENVSRLLGSGFEIVGEAQNGQALVEAALKLKPDVIVTDISMPILNGIEAAKRLREAGSTSKVVFLTVLSDPDIISTCMATGALGYVVKARLFIDLEPAIREAIAGRVFISAALGSES